MREALLYLLPCVYAFLACIGFSMLFNIHGAGMLICAGAVDVEQHGNCLLYTSDAADE